jgi:hypothetical protein
MLVRTTETNLRRERRFCATGESYNEKRSSKSRGAAG